MTSALHGRCLARAVRASYVLYLLQNMITVHFSRKHDIHVQHTDHLVSF